MGRNGELWALYGRLSGRNLSHVPMDDSLDWLFHITVSLNLLPFGIVSINDATSNSRIFTF